MDYRIGRLPGPVKEQFVVDIKIQDLQSLRQPVAPLVQDLGFVFADSHVYSSFIVGFACSVVLADITRLPAGSHRGGKAT